MSRVSVCAQFVDSVQLFLGPYLWKNSKLLIVIRPFGFEHLTQIDCLKRIALPCHLNQIVKFHVSYCLIWLPHGVKPCYRSFLQSVAGETFGVVMVTLLSFKFIHKLLTEARQFIDRGQSWRDWSAEEWVFRLLIVLKRFKRIVRRVLFVKSTAA